MRFDIDVGEAKQDLTHIHGL